MNDNEKQIISTVREHPKFADLIDCIERGDGQ